MIRKAVSRFGVPHVIAMLRLIAAVGGGALVTTATAFMWRMPALVDGSIAVAIAFAWSWWLEHDHKVSL